MADERNVIQNIVVSTIQLKDKTMNKIAIAIQINDHRVLLAAQWPKMRTLAYRLKRNISIIAHSMAMAIIPLPSAGLI